MAAYGKMNPKHKKVWVKALESENFKQTTATLYSASNNAYCCLGVAKSVCLGEPSKKITGGSLNPAERESLGLTDRMHDRLVELNDSDGKNFKQIASWIRKHL